MADKTPDRMMSPAARNGTTAAAADDATGAPTDAEAAEAVRRGNTGIVPAGAGGSVGAVSSAQEDDEIRRSNADADRARARKRDAEKAKRAP